MIITTPINSATINNMSLPVLLRIVAHSPCDLKLILCSGGMNGYISLCNGDPCPPVFRSPVKGLEDIMDNRVM